MDERDDKLVDALERLNHLDEETRKTILQDAVDEISVNRYGETLSNRKERRERLRKEKESKGEKFPLFGRTLLLTRDDRRFFGYYLKCIDQRVNALNEAVTALEKAASKLGKNEDDFSDVLLDVINAFWRVGSRVWDPLWEEVIKDKVYSLKKEEITEKMTETWWSYLADIEGFLLGNWFYQFQFNNAKPDPQQLLDWLKETGKNGAEMNRLRGAVEKVYLKYVVSAVDYVDAYGVLQNTYDYETYETIRGNIIGEGISVENRAQFIDNLAYFPDYFVDYIELLINFGDRSHEIQKIMEFMGCQERYRQVQIMLLDKKVPEIKKIKNFSKYEENQLIEFQHEIKPHMDYYGLCSEKVSYSAAIDKRLAEIDSSLRTVRGKLYETRDEAEKVRGDYRLLGELVKKINFYVFDLFDETQVSGIQTQLLAVPFQSEAFQKDKGYVLNELEPVLDYHRQLQTWRTLILGSREPWEEAKRVVINSSIRPELKDKIKYWDFNGLKKYCPSLLELEKPIFFIQASMFGWSNYFVLTNKRVLHIEKNTQSAILIDEKTTVTCQSRQILFSREGEGNLGIPIRYPEDSTEYLTDVWNVIIRTLGECDEVLFDTTGDLRFSPSPSQQPGDIQSGESDQNEASPLLKNTWKRIKNLRKS